MHVRPATEDDIERIVEMAHRFYDETLYARTIPSDAATSEILTRMLINTGVMLVAEHEGRVVGMVGLAVVPFMFNRDYLTAHEVIWWVEPEARSSGAGMALMRAIEPACKARGAMTITMMHMHTSPPQAREVYLRLGYTPSEHSYNKEI